MGHYASEFGQDRRNLLDLIEEHPKSADEELVMRLVDALRAVQEVANRWQHTGLSVSSQIDKAIDDGLYGSYGKRKRKT